MCFYSKPSIIFTLDVKYVFSFQISLLLFFNDNILQIKLSLITAFRQSVKIISFFYFSFITKIKSRNIEL